MTKINIVGVDLRWRIIHFLNKYFLQPRGLTLQKFVRDEWNEVTSPKLMAKLFRQLEECYFSFFSTADFIQPKPSREEIRRYHEEFQAVFANHPFPDNRGGSGRNECSWYFLFTRWLNPSLIVECGTHKGFSAWLFRQAAPRAQIETFDIDHTFLTHREPSIHYHCADFTQSEVRATDEKSLIFFDDHVNQAARVILAHDRGFRWALFQGNFPAETLYTLGDAPVPTLAMVMDSTLEPGETIEWMRNRKRRTHQIDGTLLAQARALIEGYAVLPELGLINRRGLQYNVTLVKLRT